MVAFYEAYTSVDFHKISERLRLHEFVQLPTVQPIDNGCDFADYPLFLSLTTFTNHVEILNHVRSIEERVFYVLYAARERLTRRTCVA